jgi:hypothetical protein
MSGSRKAIIICVLLIFLSDLARTAVILPDARQDHSIVRVIAMLEQAHQVRIFYDPGWFETDSFPLPIPGTPVSEALNNILRGRKFRWIQVYDYYVIMPADPDMYAARYHDTLVLTIGDPAEFGRYGRIDFRGRILDGVSGEPLPGAVIYSEKSGAGSATSNDGSFSINLPAGELLLRLSFIGYEDQYRRVNMLGPGEYDFYLFEEVHIIDEVTIMARRAEENILRTRMSMITMDSRALRELPGNLGEQDIIRSMGMMPGVHGTGEFGTEFHVRGGSGDQNLILLEGVPLFNSSHLFGLFSVVNTDMVSEMTLYKGSMPARYGERVSSVMDIRVNPQKNRRVNFSGGIGLLTSRLHLEAPLGGKVTFSIGGRTSWTDYFLDRIPAEELLNSSARFRDISSSLHFSPDMKNNLSLFGYQSRDAFSYAGESEFEYSNTLASARWNRVIGERFSVNIAGGLSLYDYNVLESEGPERGSYTLNTSVDYRSLKSSLLWFPEGHRAEIGINAILYNINPGRLEPLSASSAVKETQITPEKGTELSLFLSDEFELTDRISAEAGIRFTGYLFLGPAETYLYDENMPRRREFITDTIIADKNRKVAGHNALEPRFSIRYKLGHSGSLKAGYSVNHQYIRLISNTAVINPSDVWKLSDPNLPPLRSESFSAGFFRNFRNNMIETSAEVYFRKMQNLTEYKDGSQIVMNELIETTLTGAKGYGYGMELYLGKNSGRLSGWMSYTWSRSMTRTTGRFPEECINGNTWFPSAFDKPHELVINTGYNVSRRWRIGATFNYSTGRPVTLPEMYFPHGGKMLIYYSDRNKYRLPPYHRLDISLTRNETLRLTQKRKGNWTISVINLYGRKNPYSVFYERGSGTHARQPGNDSFNLYKLYIIGRAMPTLTYNFRF